MFVYQSTLLDTLYKTDRVPSFFINEANSASNESSSNKSPEMFKSQKSVNISAIISETAEASPSMASTEESKSNQNSFRKLFHGNSLLWKRLPHTHWPMLFGLYNISLYGNFISILPPIHLSMIITPDSAKQLRHPLEVRVNFCLNVRKSFNNSLIAYCLAFLEAGTVS